MAIQIPSIQSKLKNWSVSILEDKIHTKVRIGHISLGLPKLMVLEDVYFQDQKSKTLLSGRKLKVDINLFKLLNHTVEINEINLEGVEIYLSRVKNGTFNYDYIFKAFEGNSPKPKKALDTSSNLKVSLNKIILNQILISYKDSITDFDIIVTLNHFDCRIGKFNLQKTDFSFPLINLQGVNAKIRQFEPAQSPQTIKSNSSASPINLSLSLNQINLSKIKIDFVSPSLNSSIYLGNCYLGFKKIDFKDRQIALNNFTLTNTYAFLSPAKTKQLKREVLKSIHKIDTIVSVKAPDQDWQFDLGILHFLHNSIRYDNQQQRSRNRGFDPNHFLIRDLSANLQNLRYRTDSISGKLESLNFNDKSGLNVQKAHAQFFYGNQRIAFNDLMIQTPNSLIQRKIILSYPSLDAISKNPGLLKVEANFNGSIISMKDVLLLQPSLPFINQAVFKRAVFKINGLASGSVNNLNVSNLQVRVFRNTLIRASLIVKGLPNFSQTQLNLNLKEFSTSEKELLELIPKSKIIPSTVQLPQRLSLSGTFFGGLNSFNTNMNLKTSLGIIQLFGSLNSKAGKGKEVYHLAILGRNLNLGSFLKRPHIVGLINVDSKISGVGFVPKKSLIHVSGKVYHSSVMGYTYQNLQFQGNLSKGIFSINSDLNDPAAKLSLVASGDISNRPSIKATLKVDSINFKILKFTDYDLRFHGLLKAHIDHLDINALNADLFGKDLLLYRNGQRISVDSLNLISTANKDSSSLRLESSTLLAKISGHYHLAELGDDFTNFLNLYFESGTIFNKKAPKINPVRLNFSASIYKTPLLSQLFPSLLILDPVQVKGHFYNEAHSLELEATVPRVQNGAQSLKNMKLNLNSDEKQIQYNFFADEIKVNSGLDLLYTDLGGSIHNNLAEIKLLVKDALKKNRYQIAGVLHAGSPQFRFNFNPDGLLLDYIPWKVTLDNQIDFSKNGIFIHDFQISHDSQSLLVKSSGLIANTPLEVNFKDFRIETLSRIVEQDSLQIGGLINGIAHISLLNNSPEFISDLKIQDFNFKGDTLGNLLININNKTTNSYQADLTLEGKGNKVNLSGFYYTSPSQNFDLKLTIGHLNLKSLEGFSSGNFRNSTGFLNGNLSITGSIPKPLLIGEIKFNQVGFNVSRLNDYFSMPEQKVSFNQKGLLFKSFTLIDSAGGKAELDGEIQTKNYVDYDFFVDINSHDFRVINSTSANNKLYYGQLYISSLIKIRGDINTPVVDANLIVNNKTNLTIVIPQSDPGIEERNGIIEAINIHHSKSDSIFLAKEMDSLRHSDLNGLDINATINVNKNANFTVILDAVNGDVVHLQGEAQLNGGIDPSGKTNLTGTYIVNQGSYNLSYATVKRKFSFRKGSSITWTGDPTSAILDLTATYVANVPPIDLVGDQLTSNSTVYKQKLPFNVNLKLKKELLKPDISFDIVLPDSTYTVSQEVINNVDSRLSQIRQDPNEMNKQVLGVLVLGHFIGENIFQSQGASTTLEGTLRNSVSSLLSDQLNKLAGNLIAGVQLNFDLTSGADYSTGAEQNRTDLQVGLTKQFLNDRVSVTVGNNFNLEGQNQPGQKTTDIAGNVSVNYRLTKDGRYIIRAYRKNEFIVIEGEVVETGIAFILTYDFERFKELFTKRSAKEKEMDRKYLEDQKLKNKQQKNKTLKENNNSTRLKSKEEKDNNVL